MDTAAERDPRVLIDDVQDPDRAAVASASGGRIPSAVLRRWVTLAAAAVAAGTGHWLTFGPASPARAAPGRPHLSLVRVAGGLRAPVDVAAPRNERGRLYIVEQRGLIRVLERGRVLRRPFLDIRNLVLHKELAGLFSVAFAPDYARSRRFVVAYVGRDLDLHVVGYRSSGGRALRVSAKELLHVAMPVRDSDNHFGGDLAFGPDGLLYLGIGDGSTPRAAQDPRSLLGKLVRLDIRSDSPEPEIVGFGLRNPWRFSFDRGTGDLYIGDVGAAAWEEIDYVRRGTPWPLNFGWPQFEGRQRTADASASAPAPLVSPLVVYPRPRKGCSAVVGGYVYRGRAIPALRGRYFYGDFCTTGISSVRVVGGRARERRLEPLFGLSLLSSFGEDARGELYALSYTYKLSQLYRLIQPK